MHGKMGSSMKCPKKKLKDKNMFVNRVEKVKNGIFVEINKGVYAAPMIIFTSQIGISMFHKK